MLVMDRLVSRSSRSLAVMIGHVRPGKARGWSRGRPRASFSQLCVFQQVSASASPQFRLPASPIT